MRTEAKRKVLLLGLALVLSGCLKSFQYKQPEVKLNEQWSLRGATGVTAQEYEAAWWRAFDDATLDQLIETAHHQNLLLRTAGLRIYDRGTDTIEIR